MLHGGAQRVLDAAAVERVDRLKLVERDDDARFAQIAEAAWQRKHLGRQARDVAVAAGARKRHRHPHRPVESASSRSSGFAVPIASLSQLRALSQPLCIASSDRV